MLSSMRLEISASVSDHIPVLGNQAVASGFKGAACCLRFARTVAAYRKDGMFSDGIEPPPHSLSSAVQSSIWM